MAGHLLAGGSVARAGSMLSDARPAYLQSSIRLSPPRAMLQQDTTIACFEDSLTELLNPGCFDLGVPPFGDCTSQSTHFLVQYLFPDLAVEHRVVGIGFLSNDAATVFPSAGVIQIAPNAQGRYRFPTAAELASLQATQIPTTDDLSVVFVNLESSNLLVQQGDNRALVVALQFPQGGVLSAPGVGPGIAADGLPPEQDCDFFTVTGGTGDWYAPVALDWAFVVLLEPSTPVEALTWTQVKKLYRAP